MTREVYTMPEKQYYVYILTNASRTLYVGVTNNLERRVWEHKSKMVEGFTSKYNINWLVWFAEANDVREAIAMEKKIKVWTRAKKVELIEAMNPEWRDLSLEWFTEEASTK